MVYADEKNLCEETKEKIEELGKPVSAVFEVTDVNHASFKDLIRDIISDEEYEMRGNVEEVKKGQTFFGNIYPWNDMYLTGGALLMHDESLGEIVKKLAEEFKSGQLLEEVKKENKKRHYALIGRGKVESIAILSDPEHGIGVMQGYDFLKELIENGEDEKIEKEKESLKEVLWKTEPFVLRSLMKNNVKNVVKIINKVFSANLVEEASEGEIESFMLQQRADWY